MHSLTLNIDDSIYQNFRSFLELLPKDKAQIIEDEIMDEPNPETQKAIEDLEADKNCESFKSVHEMFKAYDI